METNDSILKEIKKYSAHIDRFRARANTHGIWLFIATLGCWGVTEPSIRILAFVMLFFIFLFLLHGSFPGEKRTLHPLPQHIKKPIVDNLPPETPPERFHDLLIVFSPRKSLVGILKSTFIFVSCYGFYFVSFY
ncbi:hypothetical protein FMJ66_12470, partial [Klebsiella pneumoniae]|nr:hypothetical protein [Klebsiella pneumoniae]